MKKILLSTILAASAALATGVSAQTVPLSDLSKPSDGEFQSGAVIFNLTGAMVFTTGSQDLSVLSITAMLDSVSPSDQSLITHLYLAPGGTPTGAPIYDAWSTPSVDGKLYTFFAESPLELLQNTGYAFTIYGPGTVTWTQKDISNGYDAEPGWSMAGFSQGSGPSPTSWSPNDSRFFAAGAINSVPEPSTWVLLGSGVVGLLGLRRRQKN